MTRRGLGQREHYEVAGFSERKHIKMDIRAERCGSRL